MGKMKITVMFVTILLCSCGSRTQHHGYSEADRERADSVLQHVRRDILAQEPDVQDLAEGVLDLKERLERIKQYTDDADVLLNELERQGVDVADIKMLMDDIASECEVN